jgi:hypothetical protein
MGIRETAKVEKDSTIFTVVAGAPLMLGTGVVSVTLPARGISFTPSTASESGRVNCRWPKPITETSGSAVVEPAGKGMDFENQTSPVTVVAGGVTGAAAGCAP